MNWLVYIFILELFFGLNGKWLIIGGVSIRHWIFFVVFAAVAGVAVYFLICRWRDAKTEGKTFRSFLTGELATFSTFDWVFLAFLLLQMFWIVLMPWVQRSEIPEGLGFALKTSASIIIAFLYFPAVYLLRIGKVNWAKYRKLVLGCSLGVGLLHVFLYVAESIQWKVDHSVYFMERVLNAWSALVGGNCDVNPVAMPTYAVRIIYPFSIFIFLAFYFILGRSQKKYLWWSLLNVLAFFATGTRALMVALVVGLISYFIADCYLHRYSKEQWKRFWISTICWIAVILLADTAFFHGRNITRLAASFSYSKEIVESGQPQLLYWESSEYSAESEIRGTTNSNSTRILQIKYYLEKILEKPLLGHGFGMRTDCDRDMQGLVYFAKVGLVGMALCLGFFLVFCKRVIRMERRQRGSALPAFFVVVAVLTDIQFQTMFGSLTIAMAVFLFLDMEERQENKNDTNC